MVAFWRVAAVDGIAPRLERRLVVGGRARDRHTGGALDSRTRCEFALWRGASRERECCASADGRRSRENGRCKDQCHTVGRLVARYIATSGSYRAALNAHGKCG